MQEKPPLDLNIPHDLPHQLHILWHHGYILCMYGTKVCLFKSPTRKASPASWSDIMALLWNLSSTLWLWAISLITLWNGSQWIRRSVLFDIFRFPSEPSSLFSPWVLLFSLFGLWPSWFSLMPLSLLFLHPPPFTLILSPLWPVGHCLE